MSRKNFKVATAENGKTPKQEIKHIFKKKDKTPVGKVKTLKEAEARRKEREQMYRNRRINSLKRRMNRMKISEEDQKKYVEKLIAQLDAPHMYAINVIFRTGQLYEKKEDGKKRGKALSSFGREAILNEKIPCKVVTDEFAYIVGDDKVLAKLREILPTYAKIYPHVMKAEPILPQNIPAPKKPSNNAKAVRKAIKPAYGKTDKQVGKKSLKDVKMASTLKKAA